MRKTTEDFIGTCQYCFGEYKVNEKSGRIVLHGYQRPGYGSIHSQCGGTGHLPFEHDCTEAKKNVAEYRARVIKDKDYLVSLETNAVETLLRYYQELDEEQSDRWNPVYRTRSETITKDHTYWEMTRRTVIRETKAAITHNSGLADYIDGLLKDWKRKDIIGIDVPATGKSYKPRAAYSAADEAAKAQREAEKAARAAKPGKLKIIMTREVENIPELGEDWDARQAWFAAEDNATKEWIKSLKGQIKGFFPGKTRVGEGSDFDAPSSMRMDRSIRFKVAIINIEWQYRDEVTKHFPDAIRVTDEAKNVIYRVAA